MNNLSERQKVILALVIRSYTETAQPVGSGRLVELFNLDVSSATVRNELVTLTEMGLLRQPHTSAGRIPTEEGYRYFVRQLMGHTDLPVTTQRMITHQFYQAGTDMERWMRLAASVLAHQAQAASLVTAPRSERAVYKHLELINTHSHQVLLVLVLTGGEVRQQMLTLAEPVSQEQLSAVADTINELCAGKDYETITKLSTPMTVLEQDIHKLVLDEMRRFSDLQTGALYRDGLTNVLAEPEFSEVDITRRALHILEERSILDDLLRRTVLASDTEGVHVIIGGEGNWEELRECSMVLARYGVPGLATGTLGVLGPMRMSYGHTISTVRFIAGLLSNLVEDVMTE
jgi:heat-inducible transcriptional repressor